MAELKIKKRTISLFVENEIGVLAYIAGLFSGKSYNLDSLTVGTTIDPTISRMTISLTSDDQTFEQIKKQLNRSVPVIKVIDFTDASIFMKELMYLKVTGCDAKEMKRIAGICEKYDANIIDCTSDSVLLECVEKEEKNNKLLELCKDKFGDRVEIVRGGGVAIEALDAIANKE
ncbi:MAG: acetolactate synthase small subunit [Eubacterium sp.]|nr:acetolactate synthase small subunit [Eubacterium sp.]